ncbi:hypothetical protein PV04_06319 [Phialophora macrospora]|uniref:Uncharacterized protein n=1 Tax=Phialophora macrospora TaxID=1851006 RepID=A0A0D2DY52_9EURO|nr:hypothetical protein PV04_06319 [Phialophora macrospora]
MGSVHARHPLLFLVLVIIATLTTLTPVIQATCSSQSPFHPPPTYDQHASEIWETFSQIEAALSALTRKNNTALDTALDTSSYSVEVTSSARTLWSTSHTARVKNATRPGADTVDSSSRYRIASITKVFTVLEILRLHGEGRLSLDDGVDKYVSFTEADDLNPRSTSGSIVWSDITLRSLASQLSGLPRDWAQGDIVTAPDDPTAIGLPPVSPPGNLPKCDSYTHQDRPCTAPELLAHLRHRDAVFAPGRKSTYSNIAFELLGLAIANVTGVAYEEAVTASILRPLGMAETSFAKPDDTVAVLPNGIAWYWDVDEGVQNPTGGLYCSAGDMSIFLRHVLAEYMDIGAAKTNWMPEASSAAGGSGSWYGMPWEIFRTEKILGGGGGGDASAARSVTFFTKGGGLPGYRTVIVLVPEFDLGITIFTAGDGEFLSDLLEMIPVPLIRAADRLAARQVADTYVGDFAFDSSSSALSSTEPRATEIDAGGAATPTLNSSLTLAYSPTHGLEITRWISNATDMLAVIPVLFKLPAGRPFHAQVIPTFLYRDRDPGGEVAAGEGEERRKNKTKTDNQGAGAGELWRIVVAVDKPPHQKEKSADPGVWDDFCVADVDVMMYAGRPLNEVVFWDRDRAAGPFGRVELSAFRVNLTRVHTGEGNSMAEDLKFLTQQSGTR